MNLPTSQLRVKTFTSKDRDDLEAGLEAGVDLVALSFVRSEEDLEPVRERLNHADDPPLLWPRSKSPRPCERCPRSWPRWTG